MKSNERTPRNPGNISRQVSELRVRYQNGEEDTFELNDMLDLKQVAATLAHAMNQGGVVSLGLATKKSPASVD